MEHLSKERKRRNESLVADDATMRDMTMNQRSYCGTFLLSYQEKGGNLRNSDVTRREQNAGLVISDKDNEHFDAQEVSKENVRR